MKQTFAIRKMNGTGSAKGGLISPSPGQNVAILIGFVRLVIGIVGFVLILVTDNPRLGIG